MNLIIDANVVSAYSKETNGHGHDLTGSVSSVFQKLDENCRIYIDDQGQIEGEWRRKVSEEWFETWLGDLFIDDVVVEITAPACRVLRRALKARGFPQTVDVWYVRVGVGVVELHGKVLLVTEDMDFFEPAQKRLHGRARTKFLKRGKGKVCSYLRRQENILVTCVCNYPL